MLATPPLKGAPLLGPDDPDPVDLLPGRPGAAVALVCEHAGQAIPGALSGLGLAPGAVDLHVGWDIGAEAVTRAMAARLGAPAAAQRYSRLVIDCNRPPGAPDSMPESSHGVPVPGNRDLSDPDRAAREAEIFVPFHLEVARLLRDPDMRLALSIHSFTPQLGDEKRDLDLGFLFRRDTRTSALLAEAVRARRPDLKIGLNAPYSIDDDSDWFVPVHGEGRGGETPGLPHSLIEIRNDHLLDAAGQAEWAQLLSACVEDILPEIRR